MRRRLWSGAFHILAGTMFLALLVAPFGYRNFFSRWQQWWQQGFAGLWELFPRELFPHLFRQEGLVLRPFSMRIPFGGGCIVKKFFFFF